MTTFEHIFDRENDAINEACDAMEALEITPTGSISEYKVALKRTRDAKLALSAIQETIAAHKVKSEDEVQRATGNFMFSLARINRIQAADLALKLEHAERGEIIHTDIEERIAQFSQSALDQAQGSDKKPLPQS